MKPLLLFHNHLYESDDLIEGRLLILDTDKNKIYDQYIVTSGYPDFQAADDEAKTGGPIPEASLVGLDHFSVSTTPNYEPGEEGIRGNFYPVLPETVNIAGTERGEWGVHLDADSPGTLGCLGFKNPTPWEAFQKLMENLKEAGIKEIPLLVSYSK